MSPATLSLLALLAVIFLSLTSRINVGILAVALAFPVGIYSAGWKPDAVLGLFPSSLFLTLAGVTLLPSLHQQPVKESMEDEELKIHQVEHSQRLRWGTGQPAAPSWLRGRCKVPSNGIRCRTG